MSIEILVATGGHDIATIYTIPLNKDNYHPNYSILFYTALMPFTLPSVRALNACTHQRDASH